MGTVKLGPLDLYIVIWLGFIICTCIILGVYVFEFYLFGAGCRFIHEMRKPGLVASSLLFMAFSCLGLLLDFFL